MAKARPKGTRPRNNDKGLKYSKTSYSGGLFSVETEQLFYVYDVGGAEVATYKKLVQLPNDVYALQHHTLYGAGRVGLLDKSTGKALFELSDHLGNVRAVVADNGSGIAETVSYTDYYPHGGALPGRNYQSSLNFPYGYQGQEKDGATGLTNSELRQYDPRIGRWYNPDPYGQHHSPYLAMSNNPISFTDVDGGWDTDDPGNPEKTKGPVQGYSYGDQAIGNGIWDRYNTGWGRTDYGGDDWINRMESQANRGADMHRRNELKGKYTGVGQFVRVYSEGDKSVRVNDGYYGVLSNGKKETISAEDVALYNARVASGKCNGIEAYRTWQKNPNYNPGEDKYDRMFRLMGNSHLEIMQDFGGGGYNMFGGYGRVLKAAPTFETLVARMGNTVEDLSGSLEAGWADGETLLIKISGVMRGKNTPSGGTFTKLTQVAEKMAKQNGLKNVRIEFHMIYNGRLKSDPTWAQQYGYYFSEVMHKFGPEVHWEKTLTH